MAHFEGFEGPIAYVGQETVHTQQFIFYHSYQNGGLFNKKLIPT